MQFEEWAKFWNIDTKKRFNGKHEYVEIEKAWIIWQAAWEACEKSINPGYERLPGEPVEDEI